jgi:hypothetical protein
MMRPKQGGEIDLPLCMSDGQTWFRIEYRKLQVRARWASEDAVNMAGLIGKIIRAGNVIIPQRGPIWSAAYPAYFTASPWKGIREHS